ncbi:MAG: ribonuclease E/G [Lachnospiraceae bacterium]|nr:ribonuclease E/G [Lachnospiraceae bacterium]
MNELVITNYKNHTICAVYEDQTMVQVSAFQNMETFLGNIYIGRVDNVVKNINAAFVNIGDKISCYLDLSSVEGAIFTKKQSKKKVSIGDEIIVQVTKDAVKTKAPVVSTNFSLTGKHVVLIHHGDGIQLSKKITNKAQRAQLKEVAIPFSSLEYGIVLRTNAQFAAEAEILSELEEVRNTYHEILSQAMHRVKYTLLYKELPEYLKQLRDLKEFTLAKITTNLPKVYDEICEYLKQHPMKTDAELSVPVCLADHDNNLGILYKINHYMEQALHRLVYLKSGATIVIEPTEALTVIDVNTGKAVSGKKTSEDTFYRINLEAAKEIAAQIRLRNISGIIIIDFINMTKKEYKEQLVDQLRAYLDKDPVQTEFVEITKLGLVELTRKKTNKTLAEQLEEHKSTEKGEVNL